MLATSNGYDDCVEDPIKFDVELFNLPMFRGEEKFGFPECHNCNGIICLVGFYEDVILCNPVLNESIFYIKSGRVDVDGLIGYGRMGSGFGYDSRTDDYKIVRVATRPYYRAKVITLGTGIWREVEMPLDDYSLRELCSYAYCNGVCYWMTHSVENMILSFWHEQ